MDYINLSTEEIAQQLLGKLLVHKTASSFYSGYIVETEAYIGEMDMACHSYAGKRTPRLESMYKKGGTIYIYTMHTHHMLNLVTREAGDPQAVLIRAIEPVAGIEEMEVNRNTKGTSVSNGPGKLTKAMAITKALDGSMLNNMHLFIDEANSKIPKEIIQTPRIGIPNKEDWTLKPLRYYVKGNPYVSGIRKRDCLLDCWK
ncbi:DNA-3-methyladenine glycosylase [Niallia sp. 03133]|uniref:DNA-3-methyladenine glycosylase n=1 Tax=Niallia sp. 03133 TaxID=3458060 RepID=UPI004043EDE5